MTKTLAEIEAIVRFRGDFRNVIRFPSANVQGEIQAAFNEFYELVEGVNEGYFDQEATGVTVAGQGFIALPASTWKVRRIARLEGQDPVPLARISVSESDRYGSARSCPVAYRPTERGVDLYPTPDAVYTLSFTYTPVAPTLGAAREYYNGWEEYSIYGALVRMALNERRDATEWQAQLGFQRDRILRGASGRVAAGPERIPLHDGPWIDPEMMWRRF